MTFVRASRIEPRPIEWLWRKRIPCGMITVVAGRPGSRKSTFTSYLTAEVTNAGHAVVFSNQEDDLAATTVPRLEAAGAVMRRVHFWDGERVPSLPEAIPALEHKIRQTGARLLVLDAAAQHFTPSMTDDQGIRTACTPLKQMLERTGCACVIVHHLRHQVAKSAHPLEAVKSPGLVNSARAVYVFGPNPDDSDQVILAPAKFNVGPDDTSAAFELDVVDVALAPKGSSRILQEFQRLQLLTDESNVTPRKVVSHDGSKNGESNDGDAVKKAIAAEFLTTYLAFGPGGYDAAVGRKAKDVEEEAHNCGLSWATIRRAAKDLEVVKHRIGGRHGASHWRLPDEHPILALAAAQAAGEQPVQSVADVLAELETSAQVLAANDEVEDGDDE